MPDQKSGNSYTLYIFPIGQRLLMKRHFFIISGFLAVLLRKAAVSKRVQTQIKGDRNPKFLQKIMLENTLILY
jgi:hypothetical protein